MLFVPALLTVEELAAAGLQPCDDNRGAKHAFCLGPVTPLWNCARAGCICLLVTVVVAKHRTCDLQIL
jgi:hypothetical protein